MSSVPEGHCRYSGNRARQRQGSLQRKGYPTLAVTDTTTILHGVKAALMLAALTTFPVASFYIASASVLAPSFLSACLLVRDEGTAVFDPAMNNRPTATGLRIFLWLPCISAIFS